MQNTELRPLGAGEILDRAVTLFVRQFVPIVVVIALTLVPLTVLQAVASPHAGRVFSDFGQLISATGNPVATRQAVNEMSTLDRATWLTAVIAFVAVVVRLVMWSAIVAVVAAAYNGSRLSIAEAYRIGVRCWFPQVIVALAFAVLGMIALIPVIVAYVLVVAAVAVLMAFHQVVATIVVGVVLGLIVVTALIVVSSWVFMAYQLASIAVVTELPNPVSAISTALRRSLGRGMKRRTMVGGLVVFTISEAGSLPLLALAAIVVAVTHVDVLYFAIVGAGSVLLEGLVAAFVIVFAVDVRVRREGYDILAAEAPPVLA